MIAFVIAVGRFLPGLWGKQISDRIAKVIGIVVLVVLLAGVAVLGKVAYDRSIINTYQTERDARSAEQQLEAQRQADAEEDKRLAEYAEQEKALEAATREAAIKDPVAAAQPVGPVTKSYYDNLPGRKESKK